jgi:6-phosphogluconolactonase
MKSARIQIYPTPDALADAAAQHLVEQAKRAVAARGRFTIALSGGSTPRAVFERLAPPPLRDQVPWDKTWVFWGDERAVPPDSTDSNYRMACDTLLGHVPIPKDHVKPILTQGDDLDAAAQHYARVIQSFVPGTPPRFDLVLLGMGSDGHTASLFPHSPQLHAVDELVVATPPAPLKPHVRRITWTFPLINAAVEAVFLVAGADKADRVAEVLEGPSNGRALPSQQVVPTDGTLVWMFDQAAASKLGSSPIDAASGESGHG